MEENFYYNKYCCVDFENCDEDENDSDDYFCFGFFVCYFYGFYMGVFVWFL